MTLFEVRWLINGETKKRTHVPENHLVNFMTTTMEEMKPTLEDKIVDVRFEPLGEVPDDYIAK